MTMKQWFAYRATGCHPDRGVIACGCPEAENTNHGQDNLDRHPFVRHPEPDEMCAALALRQFLSSRPSRRDLTDAQLKQQTLGNGIPYRVAFHPEPVEGCATSLSRARAKDPRARGDTVAAALTKDLPTCASRVPPQAPRFDFWAASTIW